MIHIRASRQKFVRELGLVGLKLIWKDDSELTKAQLYLAPAIRLGMD